MSGVSIRPAGRADLPAIIAMLADDMLGQAREDTRLPPAPGYEAAFAAISGDPNQMLVVAEVPGESGPEVVGTLQLTFLPGLSHQGAWRGLVEAVRVAKARRSGGIGQAMLEWAVAQCRARGCRMVQLTTDKSRLDAHRFYARLGFKASHEGFKLAL